MSITLTPPVVVLVRPQMAENVGAAARAMLNFGAHELRLVAPEPFDQEHAINMACAGADILKKAVSFPDLESALQDCVFTVATSRRLRRIKIPAFTPKEISQKTVRLKQGKTAFVFGPERTGLTNEELYLCDTASSVPVTDMGSMNLGQCVVVYLYEWHQAALGAKSSKKELHPLERPVTHKEKQTVYNLAHKLLILGGYAPMIRLPEFIRRIKYLFEERDMNMREHNILMKALRCFERKMDPGRKKGE